MYTGATPKVGQLVWALYRGKTRSICHLYLYLGKCDEKLVGIDANKIPDHEVAIIKANLAKLRELQTEDMFQFFKELKCTSCMRLRGEKGGWPHLLEDNLNILNVYDLH